MKAPHPEPAGKAATFIPEDIRSTIDEALENCPWTTLGQKCADEAREWLRNQPAAPPNFHVVDPCYLKLAQVADSVLCELPTGARRRLDAALTACQANQPAAPLSDGLLLADLKLLQRDIQHVDTSIGAGALRNRIAGIIAAAEARQAAAPDVSLREQVKKLVVDYQTNDVLLPDLLDSIEAAFVQAAAPQVKP